MPRLIPPAATKIPFRVTIRLTLAGLFGPTDEFRPRVAQQTGIDHVFLLCSGRAAQTLALDAMKEEAAPERRAVVVPAYTCYSVAASVVRAGLEVLPVDIDPVTLDYDYSQLDAIDFSTVLAVNASNLFGVPSDLPRLAQLCEERGVYLIDDAAQALGTMVAGKPTGTWGDVGIYSLDRGKNLPTYSGGILLVKNEALRTDIEQRYAALHPASSVARLMTAAKFGVSTLLSCPSVFWLPASLPFLGIGQTHFEPDFDMTRLDGAAAAIGTLLWPQIPHFNGERRARAERIVRALLPLGAYEIPGWKGQDAPIYLRLPVLAPDTSARDRIVGRMRKAGIAASRMYPDVIAGIDGLHVHTAAAGKSFAGAQQLVDRLVTLPTHGHVQPQDEELMVRILTDEVSS